MSWKVNVIENTVKVSKKMIKAANTSLTAIDHSDYFDDGTAIFDDGTLRVNWDAMEWIDPFQNNTELLTAFLKFKPKGKLCFCSEEGDNRGSAWGYEFDGNGSVNYLMRKCEWLVVGTEIYAPV